jgi:hypothetical protein
MTPPNTAATIVYVFAFCSVRTRVETFATQKKKKEKKRANERRKKIGIRIDPCLSSTYNNLHAWTVVYTLFKIV